MTLKEYEEKQRTEWSNHDPQQPGTWRQLVFDCANGRKVCNCGQAYATWHEDGCYVSGYSGECGHWACAHGCQSAQLYAREHVASVLALRRKLNGDTR